MRGRRSQIGSQIELTLKVKGRKEKPDEDNTSGDEEADDDNDDDNDAGKKDDKNIADKNDDTDKVSKRRKRYKKLKRAIWKLIPKRFRNRVNRYTCIERSRRG